jgi:hypothetical protein
MNAQAVHRYIIDDVQGTPVAKRASQNLAATAVLLQAGLEPTTPEEKKLRQHLQMLLNVVTKQQAESSASRRREARAPDEERSVHHGSSRPSGQPGRAKSVRSPAGCRSTLTTGPEAGRTANADREGSTAGGVGGAMTTVRTGAGARRLTPEVRRPLAPAFSLRLPRLGIAPPPPS